MTTYLSLPMGFADQIIDLQIKMEEEQSLQAIQILSQMYRIAVDFYIDTDIRKANYFQKKLNSLVVRSLTAESVEAPKKNKSDLPKMLKKQLSKYEQCGQTYIRTLVQNNQKAENKIQKRIEEDLSKQQQRLKGRMLKRVKSLQKSNLKFLNRGEHSFIE